MKRRTKLRIILFAILIAGLFNPAFADEQTIQLSPEQPYVDIPVNVIEPIEATITTTTGLPQPGFIDSWIELWQNETRITYNDDGFHSSTNYLASIIQMPLQIGSYFIRATSYAYACCQGLPTGSYLLNTNLAITTPSPTPSITQTIEPTPTPTETQNPEPTPTPSETPTIQPSVEPTIQPPVEQPESQQENQQQNVIPLIQETPQPTPEPEPTNSSEQTQSEVLPQNLETIETPIIEPETIIVTQEQLNQEYIAENTIELQIPTALAEIPGITEIFAATEAILNVGSDMTKEQREESQSVVVAAIIVSQVASMANISQSNRKFRK